MFTNFFRCAVPCRVGIRHFSEATGAVAGPAIKSAGGRLTGFATGIAFASLVFYYQLHQDIWESTAKVEEALSSFQESSVEENSLLRHRVSVLEKELALMKAKM